MLVVKRVALVILETCRWSAGGGAGVLAVTQRRCDSLLFAGGFRAKLHNLQICASLRVTVFLNLVTQK